MIHDFLPVCRADMEKRGWDQCDFVYVCGDAYVDHPSFGSAIISRVLESYGYKVGIIAQPDWKDKESIQILGRPRLGFLVSAGNMDSMVNHYSVSKRRRDKDSYTPGGVMGKRPDYAAVVYCNLIRSVYKDIPIVIGGIELNDVTKEVTLDGDKVQLTRTEYDILKLLMQHPGQVFSPNEIYEKVWNDNPFRNENTVAVHIRHLREKVEYNPAEPRHLKVVWGRGYKMEV